MRDNDESHASAPSGGSGPVQGWTYQPPAGHEGFTLLDRTRAAGIRQATRAEILNAAHVR